MSVSAEVLFSYIHIKCNVQCGPIHGIVLFSIVSKVNNLDSGHKQINYSIVGTRHFANAIAGV